MQTGAQRKLSGTRTRTRIVRSAARRLPMCGVQWVMVHRRHWSTGCTGQRTWPPTSSQTILALTPSPTPSAHLRLHRVDARAQVGAAAEVGELLGPRLLAEPALGLERLVEAPHVVHVGGQTWGQPQSGRTTKTKVLNCLPRASIVSTFRPRGQNLQWRVVVAPGGGKDGTQLRAQAWGCHRYIGSCHGYAISAQRGCTHNVK